FFFVFFFVLLLVGFFGCFLLWVFWVCWVGLVGGLLVVWVLGGLSLLGLMLLLGWLCLWLGSWSFRGGLGLLGVLCGGLG
ncbi:hypothetical protein, partial [Pseudomonas syringae group genomosp. 7]|uniref:hypothetical protein n=1 Tax=Pseudomonas syringae group genomosp. 7 TaxID=251699 RepID=UPI00376FEA56